MFYYLAVSGRPHMRSTLVGLLWGNQPEVAARASLSKCLLSGSGAIIGGERQFDIAFACIPVGDNAFASKLGVMTFADEQEGQMPVIKGVNAIYRRRSQPLDRATA